MQKQVRCPKCKTVQPLVPRCASCGLDFKAYARKLKEKRAAEGGPPRKVRCPACKTVQPMGDRCISCGLDFKEYARRKKAVGTGGEKPEEAAAPKPEETPAGASEKKKPEKRDYRSEKPVDIIIPKFERAPELSSVGDLLGTTWLIFKGRFPVLIGLYLLSVFLFAVPITSLALLGGVFAAAMPGGGLLPMIGVGMLGAFLSIIGGLWAMAGFVSAACDETQGFKEALGNGWRKLWSLLWLYLMVGYVIQGGIFLFLLPGIAWAVSFFAAQFIIFEERERGMTAMLKSRAYVKGHWWAVFGRLLLITVLAALVSLIPFGGLLFVPFMVIFTVLIYKDLRGIKGADVKYNSSTGTKAGWLVLATVGNALPVVLLIVFVGMATLKNIPNLIANQSMTFKNIPALESSQQPEPEAPKGPEAFYEPELRLDKTAFVTGERIIVHFKAPSTFAANAWVGIIPSTVPHGGEPENDRNDLAYQYLSGRTSGDLVFVAPSEPGIYDLRMNDSDDDGKEVASVTIAVEAGTPPPQSEMQGSSANVITLKGAYFTGEQIEIEFSGLPGNPQDWITLVDAAAPENSYGEWFYTGGLSSGRHVFSGVAPGAYEVRVYFNWPDGGYQVQARYSIYVSQR